MALTQLKAPSLPPARLDIWFAALFAPGLLQYSRRLTERSLLRSNDNYSRTHIRTLLCRISRKSAQMVTPESSRKRSTGRNLYESLGAPSLCRILRCPALDVGCSSCISKTYSDTIDFSSCYAQAPSQVGESRATSETYCRTDRAMRAGLGIT